MERGIFFKALSILPLEMIIGFIRELRLSTVSENDTLKGVNYAKEPTSKRVIRKKKLGF